MIIIRIILLPIAILYGIIIQLRNIFYDLHIFKTFKFNKPVISIGNITAGGAGKTPFTIWLTNILIDQGKKVAVVSRGYSRKSKGFFLVSDGVNSKGDSVIHGDEPVLISLLAPKAVVAVCEDRRKAIEHLSSKYEIDIFILDDAFQHRSVYRDIDIAILKDRKLFKNNLLLPSGLLREFLFNLKRADIIINRDSDSIEQGHYACSFQINNLYDAKFREQGSIDILMEKECIAFAGIANPENFEDSLKIHNISVIEFVSFKDHYHYSHNDIRFLINTCNGHGCKYLLCTQKDLVKIREIEGLKTLLDENNIILLAPGLSINLHNDKSFFKKIESYLD